MNIKKTIKEIINPRFSIDEIENGHTKCGWGGLILYKKVKLSQPGISMENVE